MMMMVMVVVVVVVMMVVIEQEASKTYKKACGDRTSVASTLKFIHLHYLLCLDISLWRYKYPFKIEVI